MVVRCEGRLLVTDSFDSRRTKQWCPAVAISCLPKLQDELLTLHTSTSLFSVSSMHVGLKKTVVGPLLPAAVGGDPSLRAHGEELWVQSLGGCLVRHAGAAQVRPRPSEEVRPCVAASVEYTIAALVYCAADVAGADRPGDVAVVSPWTVQHTGQGYTYFESGRSPNQHNFPWAELRQHLWSRYMRIEETSPRTSSSVDFVSRSRIGGTKQTEPKFRNFNHLLGLRDQPSLHPDVATTLSLAVYPACT